MKIYTSYFYKVRFFKPNQLGFSTAKWDPKWFHENQGQEHIFLDKRGVLNGLRASVFAPINTDCGGQKNCSMDPASCSFIKAYSEQLSKLDFDLIMRAFEHKVNILTDKGFLTEEPDIILLVHEAPTNPCSERVPIQEWFQSHGVEVTEL